MTDLEARIEALERSVMERLDAVEMAQHLQSQKRAVLRNTLQQRLLAIALLWGVWFLAIVPVVGAVGIDYADGSLDSPEKAIAALYAVSGAVVGLAAWVASGKADRFLGSSTDPDSFRKDLQPSDHGQK